MIIDFRYHVASLVAVFLALGIGIIIGGALLGNTTLQKELGQIQADLARLRNDQRALGAEIERREAELRVYRQFSAAVVPFLVKDRLVGKRVALVRTDPGTDARLAKELANLMKTAGSKVVSMTTFLRDPDELPLDRLQGLAAELGLEDGTEDPATLGEKVLRVAIDRIANGPVYGERPGKTIISSLAGARIIEASGDYSGMVDILVFLFGGMEATEAYARRGRTLLDTVTETKGLLVAAVEPSTVSQKVVGQYLKYPIILVEDIDSPPGQVALVYALQQGRRGYYDKDTSQLWSEILAD